MLAIWLADPLQKPFADGSLIVPYIRMIAYGTKQVSYLHLSQAQPILAMSWQVQSISRTHGRRFGSRCLQSHTHMQYGDWFDTTTILRPA